MPYVEGFGTWPFGEEWLWEAIAGCYLPLLDVLGRRADHAVADAGAVRPARGAGAIERCLEFLREIRPETHRRDVDGCARAAHDDAGRRARALGRRVRARPPSGCERLPRRPARRARRARDAGPPRRRTRCCRCSPPTPASSCSCRPASRRTAARFGDWHGGFWLPECAYAPWLDRLLEEAGVRATCVELTAALRARRRAAPAADRDRRRAGAVAARSRDRWRWCGATAATRPSRAYRDYHHRTAHDHRLWRNDGDAVRPGGGARAGRAPTRADFVGPRPGARRRAAGVCVCALDTELLGHWWYEGVEWLAAVVDEAARQGLTLTTLDDALDALRAGAGAARAQLRRQQLGEGGGPATWSGPGGRRYRLAGARPPSCDALAAGARPSDRGAARAARAAVQRLGVPGRTGTRRRLPARACRRPRAKRWRAR